MPAIKLICKEIGVALKLLTLRSNLDFATRNKARFIKQAKQTCFTTAPAQPSYDIILNIARHILTHEHTHVAYLYLNFNYVAE